MAVFPGAKQPGHEVDRLHPWNSCETQVINKGELIVYSIYVCVYIYIYIYIYIYAV
jgi:hypothetical protein